MKVLIVSDSHGRTSYLEWVINKVGHIDAFVHLGDFEGQEEYIRSLVSCDTYIVSGNNDYFTDVDREKIVTFGTHRVLLTHGHRYQVNYGTDYLLETALENGFDIVMYGHTHIPSVEYRRETYLVNPGSISLPRQEGRTPSYMIMEIDRRGEVCFNINYCNYN